jgi:hypothetical protein
MIWKLTTADDKEPVLYTDEFKSKEEALGAAFEYCTFMLYRKVLRIEGPGGERIEEPEISDWCRKELDRRFANKT